jgi:hypothetical protein
MKRYGMFTWLSTETNERLSCKVKKKTFWYLINRELFAAECHLNPEYPVAFVHFP